MPATATEHHMTVTDSAAEVFRRIDQQVLAVDQVWHAKKPEAARRCTLSAARQLTLLFNTFFGVDSTIGRDSDLSLCVSTSAGFVFGLIGHRQDRPDAPLADDPVFFPAPVIGRYCFAALDDGYCCQPVVDGERTCKDHDLVVFAAPVPIEWSFHS